MFRPRATQVSRNVLYSKLLRGLDIHSVCEIGAGFGEFAHYCRNQNIQWVGIEPNDLMRKALSEEGFKVYNASLPEVPVIEESFDAVFAAHVIEHMDGLKEVLRFLEACKQMLQKGGGKYLILLYPDIKYSGALFWHDYTHNFVTTRSRIEQMLFDEGWEVCRSGQYAACFFRGSGLVSRLGTLLSYVLFPCRFGEWFRLSIQRHGFTIAQWPRSDR